MARLKQSLVATHLPNCSALQRQSRPLKQRRDPSQLKDFLLDLPLKELFRRDEESPFGLSS